LSGRTLQSLTEFFSHARNIGGLSDESRGGTTVSTELPLALVGDATEPAVENRSDASARIETAAAILFAATAALFVAFVAAVTGLV
jgi:hypothetical protein